MTVSTAAEVGSSSELTGSPCINCAKPLKAASGLSKLVGWVEVSLCDIDCEDEFDAAIARQGDLDELGDPVLPAPLCHRPGCEHDASIDGYCSSHAYAA